MPIDPCFRSHHEDRVVPEQYATQVRLAIYGDQQFRIRRPGHYVLVPGGRRNLHLPSFKRPGTGCHFVPVECPLQEVDRPRDSEPDGLEPNSVSGR